MKINKVFENIKRNLTVEQIMTSKEDFIYFKNNSNFKEDIDIYPILEDNHIREYYDKRENKKRLITPKYLISKNLDLLSFIKLLNRNDFFFVNHSSEIIGIVNKSDLYKNSIRATFYFLLYELEIKFKEFIKLKGFSEHKIKDIINYEPDKREKMDVSIFEKLYFSEFFKILKKETNFREKNNLSRKNFEKYESLNKFRNWVMHPSKEKVDTLKPINEYLYEKLGLINNLRNYLDEKNE